MHVSAFGINPWSEFSGSADGESEHQTAKSPVAEGRMQRQSLSPRPVTADSFLRRETPKRLQDGPQWARAADFVLNETVARSLKHSLLTPTNAMAEVVQNGLRPMSVGGDDDGGRRAQLGQDASAVLASRPRAIGGKRTTFAAPGINSLSKQGTGGVINGTPNSRRRRKQRPVRGLTRWQQGQSKGVLAVVGAGRSVVYDDFLAS